MIYIISRYSKYVLDIKYNIVNTNHIHCDSYNATKTISGWAFLFLTIMESGTILIKQMSHFIHNGDNKPLD